MANTILEIKSQVKLRDIESKFTTFRLYKGKTDLKVPDKINETGAFGIIPALIQLIGTWVRFNSNGKILSSFDANSLHFKEQIEQFLTSELGITCAALLDNLQHDIPFYDKNETVINDYLAYQKTFEGMKLQHRMKGDKVFLACFDHLGQNGLIPQFYLDSDKINSEQDVKDLLISKISTDVLKNVSKSQLPAPKLVESLTRIIYELFENTHSWGRHNYNGIRSVRPNARGVYIKNYQIGTANIKKYTNRHDGLSRYFKGYLERSPKKDLVNFLEISVFDLGSGFASIYSQAPITSIINMHIQDEVNVVKSCLTKNNTSANNSNYRRGLGLNNVLNTLNHRGFIRIRSGGVALYRDLISVPYQEEKEVASDVILFDWENESKELFKKMAWSAGSLLTFLLPVDYNPSI